MDEEEFLECGDDNATPVKAYIGVIEGAGWQITILAHAGHFHVAATQNTPHENYSEAEHYCKTFMEFMPTEWRDITELIPDSAQAIPIPED